MTEIPPAPVSVFTPKIKKILSLAVRTSKECLTALVVDAGAACLEGGVTAATMLASEMKYEQNDRNGRSAIVYSR